MNNETKPARKIKLKPDDPAPKSNDLFMPVDKALFGLVAIALVAMLLIALAPKGKAPETVPPSTEQGYQYEEGQSKTWKEPGSARDTFNQNFSR